MKEIFHNFQDTKEQFFARIDESGGWPWNAKSVVLKHTGVSGDRPCYFSQALNIRNEWNTSIYTSDDYYLWKLSPTAISKIKGEERTKIIREISSNF